MISARRSTFIALATSAFLTAWIFWLRAPTFGVPVWSIDEANLAVAGQMILDGDVLYRDIADHRTPLSYYAAAALFAFTGVSVKALHVLTTVLIAATALLLFLLVRRTRNTATGLWSAVIFLALAGFLLDPADAYAAHTEWFLILFTTAAALVFLSPSPGNSRGAGPGSGSSFAPTFLRSFATGTLFAFAFLSKQPALVELGAPLGTLLYFAIFRSAPPRLLLRSAAGLLLGFAVVLLPVAALFFAAGAWDDAAFYTWIYNTRYYGPETSWLDRLVSAFPFFAKLLFHYPFVFAAGLLAAFAVCIRLAQLRPSAALAASRPWEIYLLLWCATSLAAAMASGRSFDHYFIQCLPSFAWMAAWLPGLWSPRLKPLARWSSAALLTLFAASLLLKPLAARKVSPPPPDPALGVSKFIRHHSVPSDRIFVWGFNADIHLYTERQPASRYLFCTFQTGLVPWTNLDPSIDTSYAIAPGAMENLLADLHRTSPRFIVDCSAGPHRGFAKYPLRKFPPLNSFVAQHYVEIDPDRYRPQGFRLFMRRAAPAAPFSTASPRADRPAPSVDGPNSVGRGLSAFTLGIFQENGADAQRLSLLLDGTEFAAVEFPSSNHLTFRVEVPFDPDLASTHTLQAIATWSDGSVTRSSEKKISVMDLLTTPELLSDLALARVSGRHPASGARALLNPGATTDQGQRIFSLHAPSLVRYELPADARILRGNFGLPPGAYAPDNNAPSDGAQFIIRVVDPAGNHQILLDRLLRPAVEPADRPTQTFAVPLPRYVPNSILELEITPGPHGNPSSDWTFWSDVTFETAP